MRLEIREFEKLTVDELYKLLKLRFDVFVIEQECFYDEFDNIDLDAVHFFFQDKNDISAYLRVYRKDENVASIGRVVAHPTHRKNGLARKLMLEAIDFIRNKGDFNRIEIGAQTYLKDFYHSLGFEQISDEYDDCGIPHYTMEYVLDNK